jgi:hypothetical protein
MEDMIEISEINLDNDLGGWDNKKSKTNFGGGLELLMNDKVKDRPTSDIELDDLNNLESELNNLVEEVPSTFKPKSDLFDEKPSVSFSDGPSIGRSTAADSAGDTKTWDGYGKFNNIPMNIDVPISSQMTKEELLKEKFKILRKLEALEKKGVELTKKYNMDSSLTEMQGEYETIMDEKAKQNSIKFQGNMLMAVINGIEFLNGKFDPFDIKLDGWNEQINENISDYDEIFGELHEKYKSKASMAPELKLLFQLGGSAMMVHMTNTMFKSAMPGMDDILRQNPELMRSFQNAAVNSMSQTNPGFSGFMNNMMNNDPQVPQGRGPPPPMATQTMPTPPGRPGNNNSMGRSNFVDDGISMREGMREEPSKSRRNEMKGPSDISDIISGLKTKTINIQDKQQQQFETGSTISIEDLKDIQGTGNMPKKSGRRKKSESNTVSLDI